MNPLYLIIDKIDGFIELNSAENDSKYLNIALTDSNKEVLQKYAEVWRRIKDQIAKINGSSVKDHNSVEYEKNYTKIKFDSDDNLSLGVVLNFHKLAIVIRCFFEKDGRYYPQIFLDDSLYEI